MQPLKFLKLHLCTYFVCVCVTHSIHVEVRDNFQQLVFFYHKSWELNSNRQAWRSNCKMPTDSSCFTVSCSSRTCCSQQLYALCMTHIQNLPFAQVCSQLSGLLLASTRHRGTSEKQWCAEGELRGRAWAQCACDLKSVFRKKRKGAAVFPGFESFNR